MVTRPRPMCWNCTLRLLKTEPWAVDRLAASNDLLLISVFKFCPLTTGVSHSNGLTHQILVKNLKSRFVRFVCLSFDSSTVGLDLCCPCRIFKNEKSRIMNGREDLLKSEAYAYATKSVRLLVLRTCYLRVSPWQLALSTDWNRTTDILWNRKLRAFKGETYPIRRF